jgi:O-antigen/teichoic acid export membrane protein
MSIYHTYILDFFINKKYENAKSYIPIFVYVFVISNTYWFLFINPIFQANKTKYLPFIALISGLVSIFTCILLIPKYGINGAILSILFGYLIMNISAYSIVNKFMKLRYDHLKLFSIFFLSLLFFLISLFISNKSIFLEILLKSFWILVYLRIVFYFKYFDLSELKLLRKK